MEVSPCRSCGESPDWLHRGEGANKANQEHHPSIHILLSGALRGSQMFSCTLGIAPFLEFSHLFILPSALVAGSGT